MSIASALETFHRRHEALKKFVHEGMRYPLPRSGQRFMAFVYFSIPVIGGYGIMQWAIGKSHASIGEHGEKLPEQDRLVGNVRTVDEQGRAQKVGAGGWGGGVRLAVTDEETQRKNQEKLKKFFRRQRKMMAKKKEQEQQHEEE